jgi:hypothetical protein
VGHAVLRGALEDHVIDCNSLVRRSFGEDRDREQK